MRMVWFGCPIESNTQAKFGKRLFIDTQRLRLNVKFVGLSTTWE